VNVKKNPQLTPELYAYVLDHNPPLGPVLRELVEVTREQLPHVSHLQVSEEQGPLLAFLVRLIGARQIVEVGTFTGFSALAMAQAMPADGRLITCDVSEEWTSIARQAWEKAGVADRIDLRIAPATRTLRALPAGQWIDLAFIDADKGFYTDYYEELVPRLVPGGLLVADNTLYHGAVIDPETPGGVAAIRAFNDHVRADERVDDVLLTVADGLTLARRR